ncbi:RNA polymerase sigma factor [Parahaliea aestuarii]|uniref:RNA polymerase sigma factor n=1 Tax=Parahaliea aestuarii TaxID=1852021 RepID=A0A5C8ZLY4_9GAMM|nr:RNA polymerase sigma factor [Parahaliea aestuarii]TXS89185.1 RNA polymerase sigma factor [Parahaliea aestuarii]
MSSELEDRIRRAQRGDREAFSRLVEDHYASMYRFALKYCGQRADAEDITQQACIKLARSLGQFRFQAAFTTWLYRLVVNCALDWQRARRPAEPIDSAEPVYEESPDSALLLRQVMARVQAMGEGYCETLVLVLGEGFSHAEAAAVLEVKESTVSWRLHEIRKRLQREHQPGVEV